jgi:hypothetical protein
MRLFAICMFCLCLFAACDGETPDFLADTPGAPFTISENHYRNALFTVAIPDGWSVITSAAEEPLAVFFLRGECEIISVSAVPTPPQLLNCHQTELQSVQNEITLPDGATVALYASALPATWREVEMTLAVVAASVSGADE